MPTAHATSLPHPVASRPVPELLLELAYYLHATRTVARVPRRPSPAKSEPLRPSAGLRPPAPQSFTAS